MTESAAAQALREGIAEAKAGRRAQARALLTRATEEAPENITAWLWLSGVMETPEEQEHCLRQALALDPDHAAARRGLAVLAPRVTDALLLRGIAAAEIGKRAQARTLLLEVTERDEENVLAWLWLSRVLESPADCKLCLENVLALDPAHAEAREELAALERRLAPEPRPSPIESIEAEPPSEATLAWQAAWARYDNIYTCPYCAAPTQPDDKRCPTCRNPLWIKSAQRDKPSVLYWVLWSMQVINVLSAFSGPLVFLAEIGRSIGLEDFLQLLPLYLGGAGPFQPEVAVLVLEQWPRWQFFLTWIPALGALGLLIAITVRWTPVYYLLLVNAALTALLALVSGALIEGPLRLLSVGCGLAVAIAVLTLTLNLEADFVKKQRRILLQVDRGVTEGLDFFSHGERYAAHGMWALAAIHLRRAAALLPGKPASHVALTRACLELGELTLAAHTLEGLRQMSPRLPELDALEAALGAAQARQSA